MYDEVPGEYWGYAPNENLEWVLAFAVVAALALGCLVTWLLMRNGEKTRREQAIRSIYESINHSARGAAAAVGPASVYGAELLAKKIKDLLGPVMDFNAGLGKHFKALEEALKVEAAKPVQPRPGTPGCTCVCSCGCAGPAVAAEAKAKAGDDSQAQSQGQSQVSILTSGSVILAAPHTAQTTTAPPPPPEKPVLDHQQRVRLAAGEFAHYWSHEAQRKDEMRRAQTALLTRAPAVELPTASTSANRGK